MLAAVFAGAGPAAAAAPVGCHPRPVIAAQVVSSSAADRLRQAAGTTRGARPDELRLRDGRVLMQAAAGEPGAIFTSEAFRRQLRALEEEARARGVAPSESFHVLRGLIDDGDRFAAEVPRLLGRLVKRLDDEGLGAPSPEAIDRLAARWREAGCRVDAQLYRELTAWAGERAIALGKGQWATRAGDGLVEPVIEIGAGKSSRQIAPWQWVGALLDGSATAITPLVDDAIAPPKHAPTHAEPAPADGGVPDGGESDASPGADIPARS